MASPVEGYIYHTYGPDHFVRHAVASVITLRRYDTERPVALFCPPSHREALAQYGLDTLFEVIEELPEDHRSIVGFKHHLHRFMPFDRSLFIDADIVWCRDPDPLWQQLSAYSFTITGVERADVFFGGPKKGFGVLFDIMLDRRRRTMEHFGLTHLPRVQAGMIYAQDRELAETVCTQAAQYLARRDETHFRSRLKEGRSEESCEWSLAMAMSRCQLPIFPWYQGYNSPQLDFVATLTEYDAEFEQVTCRYYCDRLVYSIRNHPNARLRMFLIHAVAALPGRGDYQLVTPFAVHFGSLHEKQPFYDFSARAWARLAEAPAEPVLSQVE